MVKDKGLVVLTSCSHRGVINTVRQAKEASGIDKVHAVIGGFHVVPPLGDDYINKTIEEFREIDPDYLITASCVTPAEDRCLLLGRSGHYLGLSQCLLFTQNGHTTVLTTIETSSAGAVRRRLQCIHERSGTFTA